MKQKIISKIQEIKQFLKIAKQLSFGHPDNRIYLSRFILVSACIIGVLVALLVIALKAFLYYTYQFTRLNNHKEEVFIINFLPVIGFLISAILIKKIFNKHGYQSGLSQIYLAIAQNKSKLPFVQIFSQIFTSGITIGLGGSMGIETPSVVMGASLGSNYGKYNHLLYNERTLLLCCGVAASISAAFNAPIAGVLFTLEILTLEISISAFTPILVSAATASLMVELLLPEKVIFNFSNMTFNHLNNLHFYILLGVLCGWVAIINSRIRVHIELAIHRLKMSYITKAIVGGLVFSMVLFVFPALFGDGYRTLFNISTSNLKDIFINSIIAPISNYPLGMFFLMLALVFFKPIACALTLGSGGEGGNFAPALFIGACLGCAMGLFLNYIGSNSISMVHLALAGMAGILAGTYYAPLTAIFLITEMTGGYSFIVPLIFVVTSSYAFAKYWEPYPLEISHLVKKGLIYTNDLQKNILTNMKLQALIEDSPIIFTKNQTFKDVKHLIANSNLLVFPVLNESKSTFEGLLYVDNLRIFSLENTHEILDWELSKLMTISNFICYPNSQVNDIMNIFDKNKLWVLPIVNSDNSFVGFVYKEKILEQFRKNISSSSIIN